MALPRWDALEWLAEDVVRLDDVTFWLTTTDYQTPSTPAAWVLLKERAGLSSYQRLLTGRAPEQLLEIGFWHGAGLAFWDRLLQPQLVLGVDLYAQLTVLTHYMATHPDHHITPYTGLRQEDAAAMTQILTRHTPGQTLDLVIDDASHVYAHSRAAFATVFPWVQPGGLYVLEDWGWAHWPGVWQTPQSPLTGTPLSTLVFELVMLQASRPDLVAALDIDAFRVAVVRGTAALPPTPLDLDALIPAQGQRLVWQPLPTPPGAA